jgi:hypothetical protein
MGVIVHGQAGGVCAFQTDALSREWTEEMIGYVAMVLRAKDKKKRPSGRFPILYE